jgi:hypothetical protein
LFIDFDILVWLKVLEEEDHEFLWSGIGRFKLTVRLPTDFDEAPVSRGMQKKASFKSRAKYYKDLGLWCRSPPQLHLFFLSPVQVYIL